MCAALASLLLSALLSASPAAHAADECGTAPSGGGDIICDGDDQTDAADGIEYEFASTVTDNYTIKVQANSDGTSLDIDTTANYDYGLHAQHDGSGNLTIDMQSGDIETKGYFAIGIYGQHQRSGTLSINMSGGSIKTGTLNGANTGNSAGIGGQTYTSASGDLSISMTGGSIETGFGTGTDSGTNAAGIYAYHEGTGSSTISLGNGSIHTKGSEADGIQSYNSGTEDTNGDASTSMVTMSGGTIDTEGANASGIVGWARRGGNIDIDLTSAISAGTCTSTDSSGCDIHTKGSSSHGIYGYTETVDSTAPTGNIDIDMAGGDILTEGTNAYGIYGHNPGSGALNITLSGGTILTEGSGARGIYGHNPGSGGLNITLSGGDILTKGSGAHGIYGHNPGSGGLNITLSGGDILTKGSGAHGIFVQTGDGGAPSVSVTNSSVETTIAGAQAVLFNSANANRTVTLRGATLTAPSGGTAMSLPGNGNDTMTILGHKDVGGMATTTINGFVNLSGDTDKLVFSTCRQADIDETGNACAGKELSGGDLTLLHNSVFQNLETVSKIGSGLARLHDFDASHSNTNMSIDKGSLLLDGHLDLGTGVLTIHDSNRLIFASIDDDNFGQITASKVKFDDDVTEKVYLGYGSSLDEDDDLLLDPYSSTTAKFEDSDGNDATPGLHSATDPTGTALTTVSADGVVQGDASVGGDGNECGDPPTSGDPRTITCSDSTYVETTGATDPGIDYILDESSNYTINVSGSIDVDTTADNDEGLYAIHIGGSGNLTIDMQSGDIETKGSHAYGILGLPTGTGNLTIAMSGGSIKTATGNDANPGNDAFGIRGDTSDTASGDLSISMTGGRIETGFGTGTNSGLRASGIYAYHEGTGSSSISLGNNGSIHTKGSEAYGILSYNRGTADADGNASISTVTMSGGTIDTEGGSAPSIKGASGIVGQARRGGNIDINLTSAISAGTCTSTDSSGCDIHTRGNSAHGIHGYAETFSGTAPTGNIDIDMAGGDILTEGSAAYGIYGSHQGSGDLSIAMSGGSIETGFGSGTNAGFSAVGISVSHGGTGASTATLSGGSIHTKGSFAYGIRSYNRGTADTNGDASTSTVTMSGGTIDTEGAGASGIYGWIRRGGNIDIDLTSAISAGTCTGADNSGCDIHTRGSSAHGIHGDAESVTSGGTTTQPTGNIDIDMSGGDILTEGESAHGIYTSHEGTANESIDVSMSGGSITTTGSSANPIHFASSAAAKTLALRGATLTAPSGGTAVHFGGTGNDKLTVLGHDTANMTATTTIRGDVAFGDGSNDSLTFSTCRQADIDETNNACADESLSLGDLTLDLTGAFTGLEQISKIGSGTLRLTDLTSQGSTMALQDGDLRLRGHLDLGSRGTLTIHDASRLIFGKTATDHGRITASTVQINDSELRLYAEAAGSLATGNDVLLGSGVFHNSAGIAATPTLLNVADNTALGSFTSGGVVTVTASPDPDPDPDPDPRPDPAPAPDPTPDDDCDSRSGSFVSCRTGGLDVLFLTVDKGHLDFNLGGYPGTDVFHKLGAGWARFRDAYLPGGVVSLDEGGLLLKGHLNLGRDGALHIVDPSRLMFGTPDTGPGHGSITAGHVVFMGRWEEGERVYATDDAALRLNGRSVLNAGYFVRAETDSPAYPDLFDETGGRQIGQVAPDGLVRVDSAPNPAPLPNPGDCPPGVEVCAQEPVDPGHRNDRPGSGDNDGPSTRPQPDPQPEPQPQPPERDPTAPSPCPPGDEVCVFQPETGPGAAPEGSDTGQPQAPSGRTVADAREGGAPQATDQGAGPIAETGDPASDSGTQGHGPATPMQAPATVGLASGSMMRLTAAALDQGAGPAGVSASRADFAAGTGTAASPGPWVRALAGGPSGLGRAAGSSVAGVAVGFDAELGGGLHFGTSVTPEAQAASADGRSRLSGDVWTARLGWSAGGAFADAALAWGRSEARSQSVDVITGDILDGASGMVQSHVQARAGHRVSVGGWVAVPSVSLFAGSLEHDARTARSAVLRTEAPGFTQGYHGWKAGLALGTEDWLDGAGALRWRPHLRADYERTTDEGPETLMVRKADRAGVLSFESEERVERLPRETLRLDLGAELRGGSDAWGVGVGLSSAWTDGAPEHGVQARFSLRF